jgi:hypothetical protein
MTGRPQGFLEELFGRNRVPLSRKPKVDRSASGIRRTIQVSPVPAVADIRLVDPPGAIGRFQFSSTSFVQFWCVALHPAPNGGVIGRQSSFYQQFLDLSIRKRNRRYQRTAQITNNDLGFEVAPFKQGRPLFGHWLADYQTVCAFLQHDPKDEVRAVEPGCAELNEMGYLLDAGSPNM